jgi:integrase
VFVVLKGPQPRQATVGLRARRGPRRCAPPRTPGPRDLHELRHTCLPRLHKAEIALEPVQARAGHASIESTRSHLHLADDWLASQYRKAAEVIDAQMFPDKPAAGSSVVGGRG